MNIKLNIEKNNKDFQILEDNEVLIRGVKPKWYSQQIRFFYDNRTYEIKKKSFWSSRFQIFQSGSLIGIYHFIVGKTVITFISIKQIKNIGLNL